MSHKTIPIQSRLNICTFATLARAYEREQMHARTKSDIVWRAVEQITAYYCKVHEVEPFTDVREAIDYMNTIGMPLGTNNRSNLMLIQAEADEALALEGGAISRRVTKGELTGRKKEKSFLDMSESERIEMAMRVAKTLGVGEEQPMRTPAEQEAIDAEKKKEQDAAMQSMLSTLSKPGE